MSLYVKDYHHWKCSLLSACHFLCYLISFFLLLNGPPLTFFPTEETGGFFPHSSLSSLLKKLTKLKGRLSLTTWMDWKALSAQHPASSQLWHCTLPALWRPCSRDCPSSVDNHLLPGQCPILIVLNFPCLILFCKLLSTGSLLITVHIPCKATQSRQGLWGGPLAGLNVLGGGPFTPLTRSLLLTKYRPGLMTLWGIEWARAGHQYRLKPPLHCLPALEAKPRIKRSLHPALASLSSSLEPLGDVPGGRLPSVQHRAVRTWSPALPLTWHTASPSQDHLGACF